MKPVYEYELVMCFSGLNPTIITSMGQDDGLNLIVGNSAESPMFQIFMNSDLIPSDSLTHLEIEPTKVKFHI